MYIWRCGRTHTGNSNGNQPIENQSIENQPIRINRQKKLKFLPGEITAVYSKEKITRESTDRKKTTTSTKQNNFKSTQQSREHKKSTNKGTTISTRQNKTRSTQKLENHKKDYNFNGKNNFRSTQKIKVRFISVE